MWWPCSPCSGSVPEGRAEGSAAGHPSACLVCGCMVIYGRARAGSIRNGDHAADRRESDPWRSRTRSPGACSRRGLGPGEGADVPVAEAAVDQGEQLTGHRDGGDVPAPGVPRSGPETRATNIQPPRSHDHTRPHRPRPKLAQPRRRDSTTLLKPLQTNTKLSLDRSPHAGKCIDLGRACPGRHGRALDGEHWR